MATILRKQFLNHLILRGLAQNTVDAYVRGVRGLACYFNRPPDQLDNEQIQAYLGHLIEERQLAWSSVNVTFSALRCFYREFLGWEDTRFHIPPRGRIKQRPRMLSRKEIARLISAASYPKHRALLLTTYGAGLRVSEVVALQPRHIESDPDRMMIRVEQGKGRKDRYTVLFPWVLEELRTYWRASRPPTWLFPGNVPGGHLSVSAAQRVYQQCRARAGIARGRGIHTLRHCFASHLLEAGVDIYSVKRLMGHRSISTTAGYLHLSTDQRRQLLNPLDLL